MLVGCSVVVVGGGGGAIVVVDVLVVVGAYLWLCYCTRVMSCCSCVVVSHFKQ